MKYLLCFVLLCLAIGIAGPPLYYAHSLPLLEALYSAVLLAACFYLFDPTKFLAFSADMRKSATSWFKRNDPPTP